MNEKTIPLSQGKVAIVDAGDYPQLNKLKWIAVRRGNAWYAINKRVHGTKVIIIKMHRLIARTPNDQICHHKNGNGLDNRSCNLLNLYSLEHKMMHNAWKARDEQKRNHVRMYLNSATSPSIVSP